ncbi:MAG TPA: ferritin-like domain-containing protein [Aquifex aeolicus]|nr:ferritin-like domain-containing protein [Aquifex aeolicus]
MNRKEVIDILLYDVALEHSAIIQYLYNVFLIEDPEITSEIESIARQEMRHLKWFAQRVVELGGKVSLKRVEEAINLGKSWDEMLQNDVKAEEEAIKIYSEQLEIVKEDSVKKLLDRVINDETKHRDDFKELLENLKNKKIEETKDSGEIDSEIVQILNTLLQKEYRIILDHLHHFFHSRTWQEKDISLDIAVESMVHMGKLGEKIGEIGAMPDLSLPEAKHFNKEYSAREIIDDIMEEEKAKDLYKEYSSKITREDLWKLFKWIESHEDYHVQRLKELLRMLNRFTIGSLIERDNHK